MEPQSGATYTLCTEQKISESSNEIEGQFT